MVVIVSRGVDPLVVLRIVGTELTSGRPLGGPFAVALDDDLTGFHDRFQVAIGLILASSQKFDAALLDVMLPGTSGLDLLRALRQQGIRTPVILLTALGKVEERVAELMDCIEAIWRRPATRPPAAKTLVLATRRDSGPDG